MTPVYFLVFKSQSDTKEQLMAPNTKIKNGAKDFLQKPATADQVKSIVEYIESRS